MADPSTERLAWFSPDPRGVLPLDRFHIPRTLRRRVRSGSYHITMDTAFERVIHCCSERKRDCEETWINQDIIDAYTFLFHIDLAHSVEAWAADAGPVEPGTDAQLVGGLYGVAIGGAFFGESMFSDATDASKVCLVHLVEHLCARGYTLLDTQYWTAHLAQFGAMRMPRQKYLDELAQAIRLSVRF